MAEHSARDRRGLGRGLADLLGEKRADAEGPRLVDIPLALVVPNPDQPRTNFDHAALEALASSLAASGVLQPIVVRPADEQGVHVLIAGERRWRAAQIAGLERVPAIIRSVDERESVELALMENMVRENLSPIDVAHACACLIEDFGQGHGELAARLGRSRPAISNLVRLLELPESVQILVARGDLSEGHGRAILMADGPARQSRLARQVVEQGLSVRATERLARRASAETLDTSKPPPEPHPLGDAALEAFTEVFDTPVKVRTTARGQVVVELRFADETALRHALDRLDG